MKPGPDGEVFRPIPGPLPPIELISLSQSQAQYVHFIDDDVLLDVGGFSWWDQLPAEHAGEEVLPQLLLLRKHGGAGLLPAGTYDLQLPTLVGNREVNATSLLRKLTWEECVQSKDREDEPKRAA